MAGLNEVLALQQLQDDRRAELGITEDQLIPQKLGYSAPAPLTPADEQRRADRQRVVDEMLAEQEIERERKAKQARIDSAFKNRERYKVCTLDNFEAKLPPQKKAVAAVRTYNDNLQQRVIEGCGVVFFGPPGTGKDHLMACLIRKAVAAGLPVTWKNGMDLFGEIRDRMDDKKAGPEKEFIRLLSECSVLALSDPVPPFGELTQFQAATLFRIIDGRYSRRLATWVTLNVENAAEAEKRLGVPTVDRITDDAIAILCDWPSYRKPRS